jgi:hypothetical protein
MVLVASRGLDGLDWSKSGNHFLVVPQEEQQAKTSSNHAASLLITPFMLSNQMASLLVAPFLDHSYDDWLPRPID